MNVPQNNLLKYCTKGHEQVCFFHLELPQVPDIKDLQGTQVSSNTPTFHIGSNLSLVCSTIGGKLLGFFLLLTK